MPTPITKYVNITSGVGAGNNVAIRQLIGMLFTNNVLVDPLIPIVFSGGAVAALAAIGAYFGTTSEEYLRAVQYFGYVSPSIRQPQAMAFAQNCGVAMPASVYGKAGSYVYTNFTSIVAGVMTFNFNGTSVPVTGISFAAATTLATVASILQTALRLNASPYLSTCTVTYDAVNSRFDFVASGAPVQGTFSMTQAGALGTTDVSAALGWYISQGALNVSSSPVLTPVQAFTNAVNISNNFGSFCYTTASAVALADQTAVAQYSAAMNVAFMYSIPVNPSNYVATQAALASVAGVGLTYSTAALASQYPEMAPMSIMAATDYTSRNGVQNYMYRQVPNLTASVTGQSTDAVSYTTLDGLLINYYGTTQQAGQNIAFYQDGVLMGLSTSPQFMNIFANEIWFKSYCQSAILSLQLSLPQLAANATGKGQLLAVLQSAINEALFNGVISVGKTLTTLQQLYITSITGDDKAWIAVQNSGYWMNVTIASSVDPVSHLTIYTATYTIIYSKNDSVRSVSGTHVLI